MSSRSRKAEKKNFTDFKEEVDLQGDVTLPHMPVHVYHHDQPADSSDADSGLGLQGDYHNIAILVFLYILQGIPLGLSGSIPLVLQSRKVSYTQQALFSFVFWPFSMKLLWAPIVDAAFFKNFGRRKTWLIPVQYLMGIFMLVLSQYITSLLGDHDSEAPVNVLVLTGVFFALYFLAATQDIVVDGWALTMLNRRNVGWASTCNTVGQTFGYSLGNLVFLALESPEFCNRYLRSEPLPYGVVTFSGFLYFWGVVFMVTTTLIWLLKHENTDTESNDAGTLKNIVMTYKQLLSIIRLPNVVTFVTILLTCKVGFAAVDSITGLKLIEKGVPKEKLALLAVPLVPIQIILPIIISKYTTGPRPLDVWAKAFVYRLFMGLWFALVVWWTPKVPSGDYSVYYYALLVISYAVHQVSLYCMFVSIMGFNAKISDPAIGGTYMTLLNTVCNLGGNWPSTVALGCLDYITWKECDGKPDLSCSTTIASKECVAAGGQCRTSFDGYYIECIICVILGLMWFKWRWRTLQDLQTLPPSAWSCPIENGPETKNL